MLKAYEMANDPPCIGDWRPTRDYPDGTQLSQITEFEIWDGHEWVNAQEAANRTYVLQTASNPE